MQDILNDVEQAITLPMISGALPHERLQRTIAAIDRGDYQAPLARIRQQVACLQGMPVSAAFVSTMRSIRAASGVDAAELQILVIGFYRVTWRLLARLDPGIDLDQIRALDAADAARLCDGFTFGQHPEPFPVPQAMAERFRARLHSLMRPKSADDGWRDLSGNVPRTRPIAVYDHLLGPAANGIRNAFFTAVLREYLGPDNVCDRLRHEHRLVLDFLEDAESNPQLLPFLQGQEPGQVRFRLAELTLALIALHQIDAQATRSGQRVRIPLREAAISCLYSPFPSLVAWVHQHFERLTVPIVHRKGARTTWTDLEPITLDDGPARSKAGRRSSGSQPLAALGS
jgi:hypothetical protein